MIKGVNIVTESGIREFIPCDPGKTSDGFHSFDELYEHRCLLFCALLRLYGGWKSRYHDDGSSFEGWFIAGMSLGGEPITYHLPDEMWAIASVVEVAKAPTFDGHTSSDVADRIRSWLGGDRKQRKVG